ncbi:AraC family ligand binding domain-containing protein, partial [Modestobacter roseus]|uniref:AraC family ligand binding domain-containing protein n=1 Tax=Modestobacter roseus TaxID=1181884 RepID=UPI0034DF746F
MADEVRAWRPAVPGLTEVFHAHFTDHVYPAHTHDAWTLLLVDDGAVRYDLDRHAHGATTTAVTLLPPGVPHDGRSQHPGGFRKRVLYLEPATLGTHRVGSAVDSPAFADR